MHEQWTDSDSGYKCKIVQIGKDHFKAIAVSPDGENEISFERRNRHIAKRELILSVPVAKKEILNKKTGKSPRAKKRKERKLRAQERRVEVPKIADKDADKKKIVLSVLENNNSNNFEESESLLSSSDQKPSKTNRYPTNDNNIEVDAIIEESVSRKLVRLLFNYKIITQPNLYLPVWSQESDRDSISFEIKGNYYHQKPTSTELILRPEPSNPYDRNAIRILDVNHVMIGYVPKEIVASQNKYEILTKSLGKVSLEVRGERLFLRAKIRTKIDSDLIEVKSGDSSHSWLAGKKNSNSYFLSSDNNISLNEDGVLNFIDEKGNEKSVIISRHSLNYFFDHCNNLTSEQKSVVLFACAGQSFKVNAFAGTGKTTTILNSAKAFNSNRKCYLAFNSAIAKEVRDLKVSGLQTYTVHQYARSQIIKNDRRYLKKFSKPEINYSEDFQFLEFLSKELDLDIKKLSICLAIISDFSTSDSDLMLINKDLEVKIKKWLVDDILSHISLSVKESHISQIALAKGKQFFIKLAILLWNYIVDPDNEHIFLSFEVYLKLWQLYPIHDNEDIFFIDEAQDIDPVMFSALKKIDRQKVWVGDTYQQIYRWRGAINAMSEINGRAIYLTETFRFDNKICVLANFFLDKLGETKRIISSKAESDSSIEIKKKTILFRTNLKMLETAFNYARHGEKICFPAYYSNDFLQILRRECLSIINFKNDENYKHSKLEKYRDFPELKSLINSIDVDQELVKAYRIAEIFSWDIHTVESNFRKLEFLRRNSPDDADVLMCTAHSAKGREWDYVEIAGDFEYFLGFSKAHDYDNFKDELMLFYVAITRAKKTIVNIGNVEEILSKTFSCSVDKLQE